MYRERNVVAIIMNIVRFPSKIEISLFDVVTYLTVKKITPRITWGFRAEWLEISKAYGHGIALGERVFRIERVVKTFAGVKVNNK